jgi:hypothetical protein
LPERNEKKVLPILFFVYFQIEMEPEVKVEDTTRLEVKTEEDEGGDAAEVASAALLEPDIKLEEAESESDSEQVDDALLEPTETEAEEAEREEAEREEAEPEEAEPEPEGETSREMLHALEPEISLEVKQEADEDVEQDSSLGLKSEK